MTDSQMPPNSEPNDATEPLLRRTRQVSPDADASASVPPAPPAPAAPAPAAPAPAAPVAPAAAPPAPAVPAPAAAASAPAAPAAAASAPQAAPTLDQGTYTALRTPRSAGALSLDGTWHQISPRYVVSQFVQNGIFVAILLVAALVGALAFHQQWVWLPFGVIVLIEVITMIILPRQAKALGYMLREDDVVFRKGILWQRMIAVPYGRMQLVDITQGPLDRAFGVSQLKMVTAAATTGVQIPGLTQAAAEALRDTLIEVAETRRTGL